MAVDRSLTRYKRYKPLGQEPSHITWARERSGYTKASLARALGVAPSVITEIEGGTRSATPDVLKAMSDLFECPLSMLRTRVRADGDEAVA